MKRNIHRVFVLTAVVLSISVGSVSAQQPAAGATPAPPAAQGAQPAANAGAVVATPGVTTTTTTSVAIQTTPITGVAGFDHVLGIRPSCAHVIDLLMQNRIRKLHGAPGDLLPGPFFGHVPGDLELLEVQLISEGDAECGPLYQINFRNNSNVALHHFQITIVSVLGQITWDAPSVTVRVPCLQAGQIAHVQMQLPATCLAMGPQGNTAPFETLIVALDSFDELIECNELNNVAILKRADIVVVTQETTTAAATARSWTGRSVVEQSGSDTGSTTKKRTN